MQLLIIAPPFCLKASFSFSTVQYLQLHAFSAKQKKKILHTITIFKLWVSPAVMNPYSFNVELYHEKISTKPDPRDILIPSSLPPKSRKLDSAFKFLGGLTASKANLVVVGGILAVGCTIRVLRNRCKRLLEMRTALRREDATRCSRIDVGTQNDSLSDVTGMKGEEIKEVSRNDQLTSKHRKDAVPGREFSKKKCASSKTHEPLDSPQSSDEKKLSQVWRNFSNVTETSDDHTPSKCNCTSKNSIAAYAGRADQPNHTCCHLSPFIALLALHKASMCERKAGTNMLSEVKCGDRTSNSLLFNNAAKQATSSRKQKTSAVRGTRGGQSLEKPRSRGPKKTPYSARNKFHTRKGETDEANRSQLSSSEYRSNPFDMQVQRNSSCNNGPVKPQRPVLKADSSLSRARSSNRGRGFKSKHSISQASSTRHATQSLCERNQGVEKAASSATIDERNEGKTSSDAFRSRRYRGSGDFHERGEPRRRGTGRKNLSRRPYVELDQR